MYNPNRPQRSCCHHPTTPTSSHQYHPLSCAYRAGSPKCPMCLVPSHSQEQSRPPAQTILPGLPFPPMRHLSRLPFTYATPHTLSPHVVIFLVHRALEPLPLGILAPSLPQSCSYKSPELPPRGQSQWPLSVSSHMDSQWPTALLTMSSFPEGSPGLASQTPHSPFSAQLPISALLPAPHRPHDQTSPPHLPSGCSHLPPLRADGTPAQISAQLPTHTRTSKQSLHLNLSSTGFLHSQSPTLLTLSSPSYFMTPPPTHILKRRF